MTTGKRRRPPFAMVPEALLELVSPRAVVLYALLDRYLGDNERAWPARQTMADRLKCSPDTVDRAVAELVDVGYLEVESGKDAGESNRYVLLDRPRVGYRTGAAPPYRTGAAPGTASVRHEREPMNERTPKPPTGGAGGDPRDAHAGQHANCRACGTNPRAAAKPAAPEDVAGDAQRRRLELEDLRRSDPCPECAGDRLVDAYEGALIACPSCRGTGVDPRAVA